MDNFNERVNDARIDALREIGNIGSGNAASSLSVICDNDMGVTVPEVRTVDVNEAANILGGPENISVGIFFEVQGDFKGLIMLVVNLELADKVVSRLVNETTNKDGSFTPLQMSALSEVGNIFAYSYANSISALLQMNVTLSPPKICVDMNGAILAIPSIQMAEVSDKILVIDTHFNDKDFDVGADIFLIPDIESFDKIMKSIGF